MALIKNEKVYRNLQEQVYENTCDIEELLRMYGYHGPYTSTDVIPNDDLYNRAMYLIGTGMPYKVYQYSDLTKRFTYIGDYNPDVGPEGPPGPQGPQGERGNTGLVDAFAKDADSITEVGQAYIDENGYLQVCTSLNPLTFEQGGYIKGPQGPQGPTGKDGIASITVNGSTYEPVDGNITIPDYPTSLEWNNIENKPDLSVYELKSEAFSGDYNDLTNKPTIPVVDYPVTSVNSKTGDVVLAATDIKVNDQTTVQENIDRIYNTIINVSDSLNEEVTAVTNDLSNHTSNDVIHVTASDKTAWNNKVNQEQIADMATKTELSGKLDKVSTEGPGTNYIRVYTIDNNGNQTITSASTYRGKDCIVIRDSTANINVPDTPSNQYHATSKKYVDEGLNTKLDKVTAATSTAQVYYKTSAGTNKMLDCNTTAADYQSIMMRDASGHCKVIDPVDDSDIANKKYVDNNVSNMVTTDTEQTITGPKTFNDVTKFNKPTLVYGPGEPGMVEGSAIEVNSTSLKRWDLYNGALSGQYFTLTVPRKDGTLALTSDIPDMSNFVTKSEIPEPDNIVTTNTEQTINADKTIKGTFRIARADSSTAFRIYNNQADNISFAGFKYVNNISVRTLYNLSLYDTETSKTIATTDQIPDVSNMATTDTEQTISAKKTFTNELRSESYIHIQDNTDNSYVQLYADRIERRDNEGQLRTNYLPGSNGQLATLDQLTTTYVNLKTDQTIKGHKAFDDGSIDITANGNTGKALRLYTGGIGLFDNGTNNQRKAYLTLPRTSGTLALTSDIPTDYVALTGDQTVRGAKTFQATVTAPNFTAQGSNQSTVYGGTQFVHTFADNTKLNLQFPVKSGNKTIATIDDIYYQNNDTFKNVSFYSANGYLTGGGKEIGFTIILPKNLKNIKSVTVNKLALVVRGIGGYLNGSSYIDYTKQEGITVNAYKSADNAVFIQIKMSNTTWGGTNNTTVSASFNNGGLDIKFNT